MDIKNLISGCLFDQSDAGATGVQPESRLQGSPFLSPISFGEAKKRNSAVGPKPDLLPQTKHTAQTRSSNGPIPAFPQRGKE
ncbi:MAG TPA: hypothetical protein DEF75_00080 [Comamonas kerstersii]|nr:hypothetical protein [Comamonas kerstersii]